MPELKPLLNQLNLVARDFERTLAFYRALGVDVPDGHASPDGIRHSEVRLANGFVLEFDNLALARIYNAGWREPPGGEPSRHWILGADARSR